MHRLWGRGVAVQENMPRNEESVVYRMRWESDGNERECLRDAADQRTTGGDRRSEAKTEGELKLGKS